jgi:hypothetical protein
MSKLRPIAAVLLTLSMVPSLSALARAEPLERDQCKALEAEKQSLYTTTVRAALTSGPDWVKEHLHDLTEIEKIREYLSVEEKVAFRCRTDGVRVPKPLPPPLPDPKPPVPEYVVDVKGQTPKIIAGVAAMSFLPVRKPSSMEPETAAAAEPPEVAEEGDGGEAEEMTTAAESANAPSGPSQAVADSDKTAPSENKATQ